MIKLSELPTGLDEINQVYGNPDGNADFTLDPGWYETFTCAARLPYPLRLAWNTDQHVGRVRCHFKVAESLIDALQEIVDVGTTVFLRQNNLDLFGGCFNFRPMRGAGKLSTHSWGIAVDINPHLGALGEESRQPTFIIDAFEKRNWEWGGRWPRPDGMHFQACTSY